MPRYIKDGRDPIETSLPAEGVQLRAEGWREVKARTTAVREADAQRAEQTVPVEQSAEVTQKTKADEPKKPRK